MDPIFGALGSIVPTVLGGIFGSNNAQKQQDFQANMSNTAYRRSSADMTAAGLNPMMMFGSGSAASTPSGAMPPPLQTSNPMEGFQQALASANQAKLAAANIDNIRQDTENKKSQQALTVAQVPNMDASTSKIKADTVNALMQPPLLSAQTGKVNADTVNSILQQGVTANNVSISGSDARIARNKALTSSNQEDMNPSVRKLLDQGSFAGRSADDIISPVTNVVSSALGVKRGFAGLAKF